jgi:hypothetical protein
MTINKSKVIDRDRQTIAGIHKYYANVPSMVLDGVSYTPADIVKILQDQLDGLDASAAAQGVYRKAVAGATAASVKANALYGVFRRRVLNDFKTSHDVLGEFGLLLPQRQIPSAETKAKAVEKRDATRQARHTMGKRQKADIKGTVPETTPTVVKPA